ncbi:unnamed protein product [Caenorhabditis bovis]|uniref:Uncharacterized protein n=1 Tax=Caenorhabditis bovis TaxID=2654633 RepID=A0A8S1F3I7_9PELO|nr:unnamed protein product [Caenorhabditis bovis]
MSSNSTRKSSRQRIDLSKVEEGFDRHELEKALRASLNEANKLGLTGSPVEKSEKKTAIKKKTVVKKTSAKAAPKKTVIANVKTVTSKVKEVSEKKTPVKATPAKAPSAKATPAKAAAKKEATSAPPKKALKIPVKMDKPHKSDTSISSSEPKSEVETSAKPEPSKNSRKRTIVKKVVNKDARK